MSKRSIVIHGLLLLLFFGLLAGGIAIQSRKADLYYATVLVDIKDPYPYLQDRFHLIGAMDLIPNGNCSAGKGDFIILPESLWEERPETVTNPDATPEIVEKLAEQGAAVVIVSKYSPGSGSLYRMKDGAIEKKTVYGETEKEFAAKLSAEVDRTAAAPLFAGAMLVFLYLLFFALSLLIRRIGAGGSVEGETEKAVQRLSRGKYIASLLASGLLMLGTLAWLIAPNISMLLEQRFERSILYASLFSLPFLTCAALDWFNLTRFLKYRRWLNLLCITVTALLYALLVFSLFMMLI